MNYLFDKNWFIKHQRKLLWLLNTPLIKIWFRWVMRIHKYDCKDKITQITPNSITWGDHLIFNTKKKELEVERTTDFRTHNKYSKRLYHAFKYVWYLFHAWDIGFANIFIPQLNLGFDTLTVYPDANAESTSVDGWVRQSYTTGSGVNWATIVAAAGSGANDSVANNTFIWIASDTAAWRILMRSIYLFDTSSLTASADISAAILSIFGSGKTDNIGLTLDVNVYSSAPASNTALEAGDFDSVGSTAFSTTITEAGFSTTGYNAFTLNASGIANISKTSISKFSARNATHDAGGSAPTPNGTNEAFLKAYFADQTGTTNDPKLVITYSSSTGTGNFFQFL